jgi:hypothetical protein
MGSTVFAERHGQFVVDREISEAAEPQLHCARQLGLACSVARIARGPSETVFLQENELCRDAPRL